MTAVDDRPPVTDRRPPSSLETERSVIGAAMASPDAYSTAVGIGLTARDFYWPGHEHAWAAITHLSDQGAAHDPMTVAHEMESAGTLRSLGSIVELTDMYGLAVVPSVTTHARILMTLAAKRRAILAGARISQLGWDSNVTADGLLASALDAVESIGVPADNTTWSSLDDVLEMVAEASAKAAQQGRPDGIRWGLADVDREMAPMVPGEFAVVSAFSGGGKSVVACGLGLHAAVHQEKRVLVHAMEMTRIEVGQRWVAAEARVELERIISGDIRPEDQDRVDRANARMLSSPLVIDEVETVTLAGLRASIRKHKPEFVVVDQIPTMTPTDTKLTREQQVSALAYGLKRLAKSENIAVLACCQLNANPTRRTDRTPTMHDLRESQAIVQSANTLVILSDPMEVEKDSTRMGEIDWIVRKQRQGRKDVSIPLARQFHYSRLADLQS